MVSFPSLYSDGTNREPPRFTQLTSAWNTLHGRQTSQTTRLHLGGITCRDSDHRNSGGCSCPLSRQHARQQDECRARITSQLSLALHNYESAFKRFPSGYLHKYGPRGSALEEANHMGLSWAAAMLPQLEQGSVAEKINHEVPIWAEPNRAARDISLPVFLCPSDTYSEEAYVYRDESVTPEERYAAASYAANWGPASETINLDATPLASRGVFFRNSSLRVSAVMDGLANTLAFGERHNGPIPQSQPTAGGHTVFENSWIAAVRDIDELSTITLTWFCLRHNSAQTSWTATTRVLRLPTPVYANLPCAMARSEQSPNISTRRSTTHWRRDTARK